MTNSIITSPNEECSSDEDKDQTLPNKHDNNVKRRLFSDAKEELSSPLEKLSINDSVLQKEKLHLNFDDSSDEDDIKKVKSYNIKAQFDNFRDKVKNDKKFLEKAKELEYKDFGKHLKYSFITSALGLQLFYSEKVGKSYYQLKPRIKNEFDEDFDTKFDEIIDDIIKEIISEYFLQKSNELFEDFKETHELLVDNFDNAHFKQLKDELKQGIKVNLREIILNKLDKSNLLPTALKRLLTTLDETIKQHIKFLTNNDNAELKKVLEWYSHNMPIPSLPQNKNQLLKSSSLYNQIVENIYEQVENILRDSECISPKNQVLHNNKLRKQLEIKLKKEESKFKKAVLTSVISLEGSPELNNHRDNNCHTFAFAYFEDVLTEELKKGRDSVVRFANQSYSIKEDITFDGSGLEPFKDCLDQFIPLTSSKIGKLVSENANDPEIEVISLFQELFKTKFDQEFLKSDVTIRKTLDNSYIFEYQDNSYTIDQFLANLRLCNRSTKRYIKNSESFDPLFSKQILSRSTRFPASKDYAIENQEITSNQNRKDLVINGGSYKDIAEKIKMLREKVNKNLPKDKKIDDKDIAYWIQQTLKGNTLTSLNYHSDKDCPVTIPKYQLAEIKKYIVDITYLLFGTEVVRNPASLIHHQMMLDLIMLGNKEMTWEAFFTKGLMPMEIAAGDDNNGVGAVKASRTKHMQYSRFMPHKYQYPKEMVDIFHPKYFELINREGQITKLWLENCTNVFKQNNDKDVTLKIIEKLQSACAKWYEGIDITSLSEPRRAK
jgi:hypothetical protein